MYAVIETGGRQYRVQPGQQVQVDRMPGEVGESVVFERVLLVLDGEDRLKLGSPTLDGAKVKATVVSQARDRKMLIYTYKRRQNANRKSRGHRQHHTTVKIDAIEA